MEVMTVKELAKRVFVNPSYVRRLLDEGKLPATRGPDSEPVVEREVAERCIADVKARQRKAPEEYLLVSAEQSEIEQLTLHFDEYMHVARHASVEEVVRVRMAYEAMYEVAKFAVNLDSVGIAALDQPDEYARAVVERAARVLQLTPEEVWMAQTLTDWRLAGVPAEPPPTADVAVQLAERLFAVAFWSRGRGC